MVGGALEYVNSHGGNVRLHWLGKLFTTPSTLSSKKRLRLYIRPVASSGNNRTVGVQKVPLVGLARTTQRAVRSRLKDDLERPAL